MLFRVPFGCGRVCCFVYPSTVDLYVVSCSVRLRTCVLFGVPFNFGRVCCFVFRSTVDVCAVSCSVPLWLCVLFHVPFDCGLDFLLNKVL